MHFPIKLFELISAGPPSIISWSEHGDSFRINHPEAFCTEVLPRHFRHNKLTSFQRQLNLYGFQRISKGADAGRYFHPLFRRGRPDLLGSIKRERMDRSYSHSAAAAPSYPPVSNYPPPIPHGDHPFRIGGAPPPHLPPPYPDYPGPHGPPGGGGDYPPGGMPHHPGAMHPGMHPGAHPAAPPYFDRMPPPPPGHPALAPPPGYPGGDPAIYPHLHHPHHPMGPHGPHGGEDQSGVAAGSVPEASQGPEVFEGPGGSSGAEVDAEGLCSQGGAEDVPANVADDMETADSRAGTEDPEPPSVGLDDDLEADKKSKLPSGDGQAGGAEDSMGGGGLTPAEGAVLQTPKTGTGDGEAGGDELPAEADTESAALAMVRMSSGPQASGTDGQPGEPFPGAHVGAGRPRMIGQHPPPPPGMHPGMHPPYGAMRHPAAPGRPMSAWEDPAYRHMEHREAMWHNSLARQSQLEYELSQMKYQMIGMNRSIEVLSNMVHRLQGGDSRGESQPPRIHLPDVGNSGSGDGPEESADEGLERPDASDGSTAWKDSEQAAKRQRLDSGEAMPASSSKGVEPEDDIPDSVAKVGNGVLAGAVRPPGLGSLHSAAGIKREPQDEAHKSVSGVMVPELNRVADSSMDPNGLACRGPPPLPAGLSLPNFKPRPLTSLANMTRMSSSVAGLDMPGMPLLPPTAVSMNTVSVLSVQARMGKPNES